MLNLFGFCLILIVFEEANCFLNTYPKLQHVPIGIDPGLPLFLTPYIKKGDFQSAQKLASVNQSQFRDVPSYSGYLTVDDATQSHMFFWFFPAQQNPEGAPVLLWLQGGPGASSLIGLFAENGPLEIKSKHGVMTRMYSWNVNHNLLYIDNPVGTGYSMTKDGYCHSEEDVAAHLYEALQQFFQMFPDLQKNEFFVSGESYAGKYVPAISYAIHSKNPSANLKINLAGLLIGNGLIDPEYQLKYGDYLYQLGLIDANGRNQVQEAEARITDCINKSQWLDAYKIFDDLICADHNNTSTFTNITGFANYFNYLQSNASDDKEDGRVGPFVQKGEVRKAIHVGNTPFIGTGTVVEDNLLNDIMQSVTPWLIELLSHYPVLIYNGQLDIIVAYPLTVNFLHNLKFSAAEEYKTAPRHIWQVDGDVAGYFKQAGNLSEVMVRNAGHMVPMDQPKWAFDMVTRFTHHKSFN